MPPSESVKSSSSERPFESPATAASRSEISWPVPLPPSVPTKRQALSEERHGQQISDPYRWLEDDDSSEVQAWAEAQDARARTVLSALPARAQLRKRLTELLYIESRGAPRRAGRRYFFTVKSAKQEKAVHYWNLGKEGAPNILLDPNTMSDDGSLSINTVVPSEEGEWVAYQEHPSAADSGTLKVIEVATGALQAIDTLEGIRHTEPSWALKGQGFYYTWRPSDAGLTEGQRSARAEVRFHKLGTTAAKDVTVFPATGEASSFLHARLSYDRRYLMVFVSRGWSQNDVYVQRTGVDGTPIHGANSKALIAGRSATYQVETLRDRLFILTNEGADRYRVLTTTFDKLERASWQELISESADSVLESVDVVGGKLALRYQKDAFTTLSLYEVSGQFLRSIEMPAIGTASRVLGKEEDDEAYFSFSSFVRPTEIYEFSIDNKYKMRLWNRVEVPAVPADFEVKQLWADSKDGTRVPFFVIQKRGLVGPAPTLLSGYGGFNISLLPRFRASIYPWLEAGGIFVQANLRGGGEYGEAWHHAGMLANKQNVFDDFIAVAERLIELGLTTSEQLGIRGGSNGGLLVGAAMTQRPELFGAVLCAVPLLDMLRYERFGLGKAWVPEYGDPAKREDFAVLRAYSPYHNIKPGTHYPPLLMLSADRDDRVAPLHARKFVAAIEGSAEGTWPLALLRIEKDAGHGGGDMRSKAVEELSDEFAFLLHVLGHRTPQSAPATP